MIIVGNLYKDKDKYDPSQLINPYCQKAAENCLAFLYIKGEGVRSMSKELISPRRFERLLSTSPEATAISKEGGTVVGWMRPEQFITK